MSAIFKIAALRHPVKEFLSAWHNLNYGELLGKHFGRDRPITLDEVLRDSAGLFVKTSDAIAGSNCEMRLFNRQVCGNVGERLLVFIWGLDLVAALAVRVHTHVAAVCSSCLCVY